MKLFALVGLFLAGCASWPSGGDYAYRSPCAQGKKLTHGNCGMSQSTTPVEGRSCGSDYDCHNLGQFCRKAGYSYTGVCVNEN